MPATLAHAALSAASLAALPATQAAAGTVAHGTSVRASSPVGQRVVPARVIRCKIEVTLRFPHPLTATGRLICSGKVRRITIDVQIYRNTRLIKSRIFTRSFVRSVTGSVSAHCRNASYQAKVFGKVRLKNGTLRTGHVKTRQIRVNC